MPANAPHKHNSHISTQLLVRHWLNIPVPNRQTATDIRHGIVVSGFAAALMYARQNSAQAALLVGWCVSVGGQIICISWKYLIFTQFVAASLRSNWLTLDYTFLGPAAAIDALPGVDVV